MVNVHQDRRLERYKNKDLDGANVYGKEMCILAAMDLACVKNENSEIPWTS